MGTGRFTESLIALKYEYQVSWATGAETRALGPETILTVGNGLG